MSHMLLSIGIGCPNVISRAEWGARPATANVKLTASVPIVVIHHTTAANCTTKVECMARMKRIQNYHMDSQSECIICGTS